MSGGQSTKSSSKMNNLKQNTLNVQAKTTTLFTNIPLSSDRVEWISREAIISKCQTEDALLVECFNVHLVNEGNRIFPDICHRSVKQEISNTTFRDLQSDLFFRITCWKTTGSQPMRASKYLSSSSTSGWFIPYS
ncbi:hypothetical protein J6590_055192 [Homalodisca vitripennis]|nr:hypothetical protein J6590_055192 [Homalodisca vitripennis]